MALVGYEQWGGGDSADNMQGSGHHRPLQVGTTGGAGSLGMKAIVMPPGERKDWQWSISLLLAVLSKYQNLDLAQHTIPGSL